MHRTHLVPGEMGYMQASGLTYHWITKVERLQLSGIFGYSSFCSLTLLEGGRVRRGEKGKWIFSIEVE